MIDPATVERLWDESGGMSWMEIRALVLARDNYTCKYCGARSLSGMHVDHIIPKSVGGTNDPRNLAAACPRCNLSKGTRKRPMRRDLRGTNRRPAKKDVAAKRPPIEGPFSFAIVTYPWGRLSKDELDNLWRHSDLSKLPDRVSQRTVPKIAIGKRKGALREAFVLSDRLVDLLDLDGPSLRPSVEAWKELESEVRAHMERVGVDWDDAVTAPPPPPSATPPSSA